MKRVFIFQDFKSQKFWSIDVVDTEVTVVYGKLGTTGQTQSKQYSSGEEANKAAEKLIAEKTKKGYVESNEETARNSKVEAKKYGLSYDDFDSGKDQDFLLNKMLNDKKLPDIKQLTIGCWDFESGDCKTLVDGMIANKEKFAHVEELFWGDIDMEESEISWIEQTDLSALIDIFPKLQKLIIKGTNNLKIGVKNRPELKSLEIVSGGMPSCVVEEIIKSSFPNLEKLRLFVGVDDYGFDGNADTFAPLFSKAKFPRLKDFGIINSEMQDDFVKMAIESDILPQLEILDLSCGVLTDKGGQILLDNVSKLEHLQFIDMKYNYLSEEMCKKLRKLPIKVDVSDPQGDEDDDDDWKYPMITE